MYEMIDLGTGYVMGVSILLCLIMIVTGIFNLEPSKDVKASLLLLSLVWPIALIGLLGVMCIVVVLGTLQTLADVIFY